MTQYCCGYVAPNKVLLWKSERLKKKKKELYWFTRAGQQSRGEVESHYLLRISQEVSGHHEIFKLRRINQLSEHREPMISSRRRQIKHLVHAYNNRSMPWHWLQWRTHINYYALALTTKENSFKLLWLNLPGTANRIFLDALTGIRSQLVAWTLQVYPKKNASYQTPPP